LFPTFPRGFPGSQYTTDRTCGAQLARARVTRATHALMLHRIVRGRVLYQHCYLNRIISKQP